jgi:glycine cleavage system H protein
MTAGLISYKLCTREYDCENCPLDAAMRGADEGLPGPKQEWHPETQGWEFRSDRSYHPFHSWAMIVEGNRVRWGLDVFAARMLSHVSSVVLPNLRTRLQKSQRGCWLMDDSEMIPVCSPVSGTVLYTNPSVQMDPTLISSSPYDQGWLAEVQCPGGLEGQTGLLGAEEQRKKTTKQLQQLHRSVSRELEKGANLGPTMADGGEQLADLRRILGAGRYHRLIRPFLG